MVSAFLSSLRHGGLFSLAFTTLSLFSTQIRAEQQSLPFLEITGIPGTGKSSLLRLLWKILGRKGRNEGIHPKSANDKARYRSFRQVSNLPVFLLESDQEFGKRSSYKDHDWEELKTLYNGGALQDRAVKNNGNEVDSQKFTGTMLICQNTPVNGSNAVLERLIPLYFDKKNITKENSKAALELEKYKTKAVCGWVHLVLTHESQFLKNYYTHYEEILETLEKSPCYKNPRVAHNLAQLISAVLCLKAFLPEIEVEKVLSFGAQLQESFEKRAGGGNPFISSFLDAFHLHNLAGDEDDGITKRYATKQHLNHSVDPGLIAINIRHFNEVMREKKSDTFNEIELR